ncbi:hypothetical protein SAMN06265795_11040 [Noviherbaspirillum humi]|uniref:Uncharacterized protein n=2 Tax=Noviherbaspirillum humi TaxID=1688639 RepID=A0A239IPA8_9BURK|nr:hypothetical protein SAMN06265795_11040 [Noviherbaspirillum humi]
MNCLDLDQTARRVLFGILTFINIKNPEKAVFPRRDTLRAEALIASESTLYRGLRQLDGKGYIERSQKRREHNGEFHLSPIQLTGKALVLLGLSEVIHSPRPAKMEDGRIQEELTKPEQSLQNTTATAEPADKNQIDRKTGLPAELLCLLGLGVKKSGVCYLMKLARSRGSRLGDVVAAVAHCLEKLRGREVVAYLAAMLKRNLDFRWLKESRDTVQQEESQQGEMQRLLSNLDARYDGYWVCDQHGAPIGVFRAGSDTHLVESNTGSFPVNLRFAKRIQEGTLLLRAAPQFATSHGERYAV